MKSHQPIQRGRLVKIKSTWSKESRQNWVEIFYLYNVKMGRVGSETRLVKMEVVNQTPCYGQVKNNEANMLQNGPK